jgi:GT2 family glycosyltransferase
MTRPLLSILVLARNTLPSTTLCLASLLDMLIALNMDRAAVEFVLIDDHSDSRAIVDLFKQVRTSAAPAQVKIVRFTSHRHYVYGVAVGLSVASGRNVLFVSHDMVVPPACVATMLALAGSDAAIGVIRPVSSHMDMATEHQVPFPPELNFASSADVAAYARFVARHHGLTVGAPPLFIGDAFLVTRAALDTIGVFDTRFHGFMGDIDFGVRARRSGVRCVTARGAWLYHEGGGLRKRLAETAGGDVELELARTFQSEAAAAWQVFRQKWDLLLPETHDYLSAEEVKRLHLSPPASVFAMRQPPLPLDPQICEVC